MFEVCAEPKRYGLPVSAATAKKLTQFAAMIQRFRERTNQLDAYEFADMVMRESGLATAAAMDKTAEGIDRAENMEELLGSIHGFVETYGDGAFAAQEADTIQETPMKPRIMDFLAEVSLLTDQDEKLDDHTPRVTLMTVHAAKGLEFPVVYIVGMEENLFPSQMSVRPQEIEEERRLLYVAITRAMEQCHLSFAQQRFRNGKTEFSSPSRFLSEIDRNCIHINAPRYNYTYTNKYGAPRVESTPPKVSPSAPAHSSVVIPPRRHISAAKSDALSQYKEGDCVSHRTFGIGTVVRAYTDPDSGNDKIEIRFDQHGTKTLLLTYAKLVKVNN